jgi:hypothetical protein
MTIIWSVVLGAISFVAGQIFQQYALAPIQEFRRQRADAIYFAVRFRDFAGSELSWDAEEKSNIKQMRAALIYSMELIPAYDILSRARFLGLPERLDVKSAADEIAKLATIVNAKSQATVMSDMKIAERVAAYLGAKIV